MPSGFRWHNFSLRASYLPYTIDCMSDIRAVKRNISMQHWAAIIADRNTTDLTVKEYCTRNNLSRNSYFYWLRQLRQEATDSLDLKSLTKNTVRQEENCIV